VLKKISIAAFVALVMGALLYVVLQPASISFDKKKEFAKKFDFRLIELPEVSGLPMKTIRQVHPDLKNIAAYVSATGAACAVADLDNDGISNDIILVDPRTDQVSVIPAPVSDKVDAERYKPFVLKIEGVTYAPKVMAPMGALASDINEDGFTDIVVYFWGRTPVVFVNKGAPTSTFSSESYRLQNLGSPNEIWNTSCALVSDFDGDGHQDFLFCNYFQDGAHVLDPDDKDPLIVQNSIGQTANGGKKHLLRWRGVLGTDQVVMFEETKDAFPPSSDTGWTMAVGAKDLNGDLLPEIYLANDNGPDRLLKNVSQPGNLQFELIEGKGGFATPPSFVLGRDSYKGMGIDFADLNFDSIPDIYVSNVASPSGLQERHFLWSSTKSFLDSFAKGVADYEQASESLGLSSSGWSWDCRLVDFDNDGDLESVQACGFLKGKTNRWPEIRALGTNNSKLLSDPRNWPSLKAGDDVGGQEKNCFFVRSTISRERLFDSGGLPLAVQRPFFEVGTLLPGFARSCLSRGISAADLDGDGDQDLVFANQWNPSFVLRNDSVKEARYLTLKILRKAGLDKTKVIEGLIAASQYQATPAIGCTVKLVKPKVMGMATGPAVSQCGAVDGGSGHSGKRCHDVHFGLGDMAADQHVSVEFAWRSAGKLYRETKDLKPGSYTILLGDRVIGTGER
jgi:hypothetical protein